MNIDQQSIKDLEFPVIRNLIADYCHGEKAKYIASHIKPFRTFKQAQLELFIHYDLFRIKNELSGFPRLEYDEIDSSFKLLKTKGSSLSIDQIINIYRASILVNDVISFLKDKKEDYPYLYKTLNEVYFTREITDSISKILNERFKVKDNASKNLLKIRQQINEVRKKININFDRILRKLRSKDLLGDTPEHFIRNRRVLAVQSSYKRNINGSVVGSSKTGQITFIEPKENEFLNHELEMLEDDERNEIVKIFRVLTTELSNHISLIKGYSKLLTRLDFINAKTRLAKELNCTMPAFDNSPSIQLKKAFHPLLYLEHKKEKLKTYGQDIHLEKDERMLVISGPNAGGKSITLKTIGLLQIMVQSGLLIPADANSKVGWFENIYSDIGDNQSIQNHLSTYSYRLKRMHLFLEETNINTLLLLDEFGTGSDPELGGALAEVFFEELYDRGAFAVITTHYSNIKLKAAEMNQAVNASMLFDEKSLKPLFKLAIGHPGSSFTFEVAQQNGISKNLIDKARAKLDDNKVNLDKLVSDLQHQKVNLEERIKDLKEAEQETRNTRVLYESSREEFEKKHDQQRSLIEENNKYVNLGKKLEKFIQRFKGRGKQEPVMADIKKYLAQEKAKLEEKKAKKKHLKKPSNKPVKKSKKKAKKPIKVGSTVRMNGTKVKGEVIELEGKEATVMFGNFKTTVSTDKIWSV